MYFLENCNTLQRQRGSDVFTIYYEMNWPYYLLYIDLPHETVCRLLEVYTYYINDGVTENYPWNDSLNPNNMSDMRIPS